jgi:Ser/Thr protein kinase RdoA (MazF antagonist)
MAGGHWLVEAGGLEDICAKFNIGTWTGEWRQLGGAYNDNVGFSTDLGDYVLRILGGTAREEQLLEIYRIQLVLDEKGIRVPLPLKAEGEVPYGKAEGRLLQVMPYVNGEPFTGGDGQVRASGAALRSFHEALAGADVIADCQLMPAVSFFKSYSNCCDALNHLTAIERISRYGLAEAFHAAEVIYEQWHSVESELPQSIIHGDWHLWNQLYEEDRVICILDLDNMQRAPRLLDIAYAMWVIHILLPNYSDAYRQAFLSGYGEMSAQEIDLLPYAVAAVALGFLCHAADSANPVRKWNKQYANQMPFIRWLLAEGGERLRADAICGG